MVNPLCWADPGSSARSPGVRQRTDLALASADIDLGTPVTQPVTGARVHAIRRSLLLRNTEDLEHYAIRAADGKIGALEDFYFDDKEWVIRYLVVDTGSWLSNRRVLISPISIHHPE